MSGPGVAVLPVPLAQLLPHAGAMLMISAVVSWDAESIECRASTHRDPDNPLRVDGRLPAVCALEYGAQAMAIHGALVAAGATRPRIGLLVAAHELDWRIDRLDTIDADLTVRATRLLGSANQVAYAFDVLEGERSLAGGRASVILNAEPGEFK